METSATFHILHGHTRSRISVVILAGRGHAAQREGEEVVARLLDLLQLALDLAARVGLACTLADVCLELGLLERLS
jgi:hypothetical protein